MIEIIPPIKRNISLSNICHNVLNTTGEEYLQLYTEMCYVYSYSVLCKILHSYCFLCP